MEKRIFSGLFGVLAALALIDVTFAQVSRNIAWLIKEKNQSAEMLAFLEQTFFKKSKVARMGVVVGLRVARITR